MLSSSSDLAKTMPTTARPSRRAAGRRSCRAGPGRTGSRPRGTVPAIAVDVRAAGVQDRRGRGRRPAGTARPAGSRRRRRRRPGQLPAQRQRRGRQARHGQHREVAPGVEDHDAARRTTARCRRAPAGRHAGHHVGVGDDPARGEHPAAALLATLAGRRDPGDLDDRAGGTGHRRPRSVTACVGPGHRRDRLDPDALEDAWEALAVEHRAEAGEQAGRSGPGPPGRSSAGCATCRSRGPTARGPRRARHRRRTTPGSRPRPARRRRRGRRRARGRASGGRAGASAPPPTRRGPVRRRPARSTPKTSSTVCHRTLPTDAGPALQQLRQQPHAQRAAGQEPDERHGAHQQALPVAGDGIAEQQHREQDVDRSPPAPAGRWRSRAGGRPARPAARAGSPVGRSQSRSRPASSSTLASSPAVKPHTSRPSTSNAGPT